jgi:hypothetical protein
VSVITETSVANRALQRVGAARIGLINANDTVWTEDSKGANEIRTCYHILRRAELRRNVWTFSVRRVALRAIDTNSKQVTFAAWAVGTTYAQNQIVLGTDGQIWQSRVAGNLAHDPATPNYTYWELYFNTTIAAEFVTDYQSSITYAIGDHTVGSDDQVYVAILVALNHDPVSSPTYWAVAADQDPSDDTEATDTSFYAGELVFVGDRVYRSLQNGNEDDVLSSNKWLRITSATVALTNIVYPIGSGPFSDVASRNIFQLPNGFIREAPQAPRAGSTLFLGAPGALAYTDWERGGNYLLSTNTGPIVYRFAADVNDPMQFDPMFVEGFGSRIALETCEPITQSTEKLKAIAGEYKTFMGEARTVNAIEQGPTEPPEDDYITCRR